MAEIHRRTAPRRKGVSLAVSAALLASPVIPRFASAHPGSGAGAPTEDTGSPATPRAPKLLERGDTGSAVEEVQRVLGVTADGVFGPITEAAVKRFQRHEGLPRTGRVDPTTWMKLFSGNVTVLDAGTPEAQAIQAAAGDEPTQAISASVPPAQDESGPPAATPAAFQPAGEEESGARGSDGERRRARDSAGERRDPQRTRRASGDDRGATPSEPRDPDGGDGDRGSTKPVSTEREDSKPASTPAPSGGGGGGGSCDGDVGRPVNGTVTGVFGEARGGGRSHGGMDIAAPSGTPIKAATCGRVSEASFQGGYGNIICIRASASFTTCYAHMSRFGASVGQYVKIGEVIGYVGCTGSCTGPHVHFEVRIDGQQVDPAPYLNGSKKAPSARSSSTSTMAVSFTDSTRKSSEARAAKREQVQRQHDGAAQDPAQQPQISTPAAGGDPAAAAPTGQADPTAASNEDPAATAPTAADTSTEAPGQEVDPGAGAVEETTGAVEETTAEVEETAGIESPAASAVEETTSSIEEDTSSTAEETTSTDTTAETGAVEETTSSVEEDTSSSAEETTGTDAPDVDAPGSDSGAVDETTSAVEEGTSSAVEETTSTVEEDVSSAADETTSTVEETTGGAEDETDARGEDGSEASSDEDGGGDTSGEDASGSEEPAEATAGG